MSAKLDNGTFERFRSIVYEQTGISLGPHKGALVQARVGKRLRALGLSSYDEYLDALGRDESGAELTFFVDAICTNVTSFFREPHHFDFIKEQMQGWLDQGHRRFRFWSCACSTGEEPYSLAMTLLECIQAYPDADVRILATDISTKVLDRCLDGCYSDKRMEGVPAEWRARWFKPVQVGKERAYRVKRQVRDMVVFRKMNLSAPPFPMTGPLDAVFCRNVMIYFDNPVRAALLDEVHRLLKPGGFLIVGHAESLTGINPGFKYVKPAIYLRQS